MTSELDLVVRLQAEQCASMLIDRRTMMAGIGASCVARASEAARATIPMSHRLPRIDGLGGFSADGLTVPSGFNLLGGRLVPKLEFESALRSGSITAVSQTVGPVGNGPGGFESTVAAIAHTDGLIADHPGLLVKVADVGDILSAQRSSRLAVIYNLQDSTAIGTDLQRVELLHDLGVRIIQPTYNVRNIAGDGCLEPNNGGLSKFGRQLVEKINEHRIVLDLSHAGQRVMVEALSVSVSPPVITHTGCRALVNLPRNTGDTEIKAIADRGGVVGIYFMPFLRGSGQPQIEDVIAHLNHALTVAGEDHVSIGTDNELMGEADDEAARQRQRDFFNDRKARGIAAPGEAADILNMVTGLNDVTRFDRLTSALEAAGWPARRVLAGTSFGRLVRFGNLCATGMKGPAVPASGSQSAQSRGWSAG